MQLLAPHYSSILHDDSSLHVQISEEEHEDEMQELFVVQSPKSILDGDRGVRAVVGRESDLKVVVS